LQQSRFDVTKFVSVMEVRLPTTKIDRFDGKMIHPDTEQVPLTKDNLLLRDCRLKNTDFIEGIVVYAGNFCLFVFLTFSTQTLHIGLLT
jgi:phospholipid-translocating ATPase